MQSVTNPTFHWNWTGRKPMGGQAARAKAKLGSHTAHDTMTDGEKHSESKERRVGIEPGKKQIMASLVSYGSGSVVSRTIIDRRAGTVTLFAFDEGEGLSEHTAAYDALLYLLEGEALVTISGKASQMKEGEAIVLPAGEPHSVRATKKFKMLLSMIRE